MTRQNVTIDIDAEIRQFTSEMSKIPGVTKKEAAKAAKDFAAETIKGQVIAGRAAKKAAKEAGSAWSDVGKLLASSLSASAITGAVSGLTDFVSDVNAARTEVINLSAATGIQRDTLAGLSAATARYGIEADEVLGGLEDFGEVLFDFANGGGRAQEALELLNVKAKDATGNFRGTDEVLREVLGKMSSMEEGAQKNAVAQQLFGDAGNRLNAVLGETPLEDWIGLAEQYGTVVDDEAVRSTEAWNAAMSDFTGVMAGTAAELADFLDLGQNLSNFTLGFVFLKEFGVAAIEEILGKLGALATVASLVFEGDVRGAAELYVETLTDVDDSWGRVTDSALDAAEAHWTATNAVTANTAATDRQALSLGKLSSETDRQAKASKDAERAAKKKADAEAKAAQETADAEESLASLRRSLADDTLSDFERIALGYQDQIAAIQEVEKVLGETEETALAREEAKARAARERHEIEVQLATDLQELETAIHEAQEELHAERMDRLDEIVGKTTEILDAMIDAADSVLTHAIDNESERAEAVAARIDDERAREESLRAELAEAETVEEQQRIEADLRKVEGAIAANQAILDAEQDQIRKLFEARKKVEIAGAIVSGAAAAIAALAPPPVGLGPVAGAFLAAAVAVETGVTVSEISSQTAPQFDTGFPGFTEGPDNFTATLRLGEGVTNQRATEALGGPEALNELNQTGRIPAAPRGASRMASGEVSRALGSILADELDAGREFSRAMGRGRPRKGVRPVYVTR